MKYLPCVFWCLGSLTAIIFGVYFTQNLNCLWFLILAWFAAHDLFPQMDDNGGPDDMDDDEDLDEEDLEEDEDPDKAKVAPLK